jgi:hypothetical protein
MSYREPKKLLDATDNFLAYQTATTAPVTGNGAFYDVIFGTVINNKLSNYNPATGVYTASLAGIYTFCYSISFTTNTSNVFYNIYANGSVYSFVSLAEFSPSNEGTSVFSRSFTIPMSVGDTMSIRVMASGAASNNISLFAQGPQGGIGIKALATIFSGRKIY